MPQAQQSLSPLFRRDLFQTPIWAGSTNETDLIESTKQLAYSFRDQPGEKGLVSDSWDKGEVSDKREHQDEKGVTSYYSENLAANRAWDENLTKLVNTAGEMLLDTHPLEKIKGMRIGNAWVTIYPQGGFVPQHIHAGFLLSGVFYVKAEKDCGGIEFLDPCWIAKTMMHASNRGGVFPGPEPKYIYKPTTGDILLFPSWLPHRTIENTSGEDRIIVSFNLIFPREYTYHRDVTKGLEVSQEELSQNAS